MTESGSLRRPRSRRVALATAGIGAAAVAAVAILAPTDTIASFTDDVRAGAVFGTHTFGIESSEDRFGSYTNHSADSPLVLNHGEAISLMPGQTSYAAVYLRRTEREPTDALAVVSVSGPTGAEESWDALWNEHIEFRVTVAPVTGTTMCTEDSIPTKNDNWAILYDEGTLADPEPVSGATFTLGTFPGGTPPSFDGDPYMVCFEFTLSEDVDEASIGESAHPMWTFTAESEQP